MSICPSGKIFISTRNRSKNWKHASSVQGKVFARASSGFRLHGMPGYRLTGDSVYHGSHYGLVVDMFEANNRIYQIAGMKQDDAPSAQRSGYQELHDEFQTAFALSAGVQRLAFNVQRLTFGVGEAFRFASFRSAQSETLPTVCLQSDLQILHKTIDIFFRGIPGTHQSGSSARTNIAYKTASQARIIGRRRGQEF